MIRESIFEGIESELFAATLGVVSTPRAFNDALHQNHVVRELHDQLVGRDSIERLQNRIRELARANSDSRYCHPHDLAIGVYLRVLYLRAPSVAREIAQDLLVIPNLWWGRAIATQVVEAVQDPVPALVAKYVIPCGGVSLIGRVNDARAFARSHTFAAQKFSGSIRSSNSALSASKSVKMVPMRVSAAA